MNEAPALPDVATINKFLWQHDLMGTGCNLMDEMEHEYWALADGIHRRLVLNEDLGAAVDVQPAIRSIDRARASLVFILFRRVKQRG